MTAHATAGAATIGSVIGLLTNVLPPILAGVASFCAILWYAVQLYESAPAKRWRERHRKV